MTDTQYVETITGRNGVHKHSVQRVYGPDLLGVPTPGKLAGAEFRSTRYIAVRKHPLSSDYNVKDTSNGEFVREENDSLFVGPIEDAYLVANYLNKHNDWTKAGQ